MSLIRGLTTALVVLCITATEARNGRAQESPNVEESVCSPPPVGIWQVVHNFPNLPGESTLFPQARTILTMTTGTIPGVYTGSGAGIFLNPENPAVPVGAPLIYTMIGIFNEELCAITGTLTDTRVPVVEPFVWHYDGEATMSGPYVIRNNNTLPFTTLSRHDLQFLSSS